MPFNRAPLSDIIARTRADIESRLPGSDARLRRRVLSVLADALAGAVNGLYGYLDFLSRQPLADQAEAEYLDRHASLFGLTRKAAAAASGTVTATGIDGSIVPAGTLLQRSDGTEYTTAADGTIVGGSVDVDVTASIAGSTGNCDPAATVNLVNPISGIDNVLTVDASGITDGTDQETDEALRTRVLLRMRQPPHGGASFDYINWALEVAGVTRAWCFALQRGNGTVDVSFVVDDDPGGLIPDAGKVAEVQTYIDALRPVTADLLVFAPTAAPIDFTIQLAPDTTAVRQAVEAELTDLLRREGEPGDGLDLGTIRVSHIREAISIAAGETDHVLTAPAADVVPAAGHICTMGVITWA